MGFANSPATRTALASHGIRVTGYRWRWGLGLKGGTYPPHFHQNNERVTDAGDFPALPGDDLNGESCMCELVPEYRTPDGRFAKPGLTPIFQPPPVTAAMELFAPELDLSPLVEALAVERPLNVSVSIPDGAIVINLPSGKPPDVIVSGPTVNVPGTVVNVAAPDVTVPVNVSPTPVTVTAPRVTVSPNIEVKPAPVKIIREKVARAVRFRRNANGQIEEAEVTSNG